EARLFEVQDGSDRSVFIVHKGRQWVVSPHRFALQEGDASTAGDGLVTVPMHGRVIGVTVAEGDVVEAGDVLFSVEAMKMEHAVLAPVEGVVEDVTVVNDTQAQSGDAALRIVIASES
ncbi:MAG: DUF2118 domain-containing protein, partial [Pseudomonadota bacterium]